MNIGGYVSCANSLIADTNERAHWHYSANACYSAAAEELSPTADKIFAVCNGRYHNPPHVELQIAAAEQQKITEQRLLKQVASSSAESSQTAESSQAQDTVARRAGQLHRHLGGCHCQLGHSVM